jgi:hypothetical protein
MPRSLRATVASARPLALLATAVALLAAPACKRQHHATDRVPDLPYPTCPAGTDMAPAVVADHRLRSGTGDTRQAIVEHYRIERRGCLFAVVTRQEWPMQIADVEVLYNEALEPLRIWRRLTIPGSKRPDGNADIKRFDFRTPEVTSKHRNDAGQIDAEILRGPKAVPKVLIGPGRGLISVWLRRARLAPGQKVREAALDFRGIEVISDVTLQRLPDVHLDWLGRTARLYTFLGREAIYADDDDNVIGDLAGLVLAEKASIAAPRSLPTFEPLDPVNTP